MVDNKLYGIHSLYGDHKCSKVPLGQVTPCYLGVT